MRLTRAQQASGREIERGSESGSGSRDWWRGWRARWVCPAASKARSGQRDVCRGRADPVARCSDSGSHCQTEKRATLQLASVPDAILYSCENRRGKSEWSIPDGKCRLRLVFETANRDFARDTARWNVLRPRPRQSRLRGRKKNVDKKVNCSKTNFHDHPLGDLRWAPRTAADDSSRYFRATHFPFDPENDRSQPPLSCQPSTRKKNFIIQGTKKI